MLLLLRKWVVVSGILGATFFSFTQAVLANNDGGNEKKTVIFNISKQGYPPFMLPGDTENQPSGIIYEILKKILSKQGLSVETISIPKNREQRYFELGYVDAHATAVEWIDQPQNYVFSDPILEIRNVVFSRADAPLQFQQLENLIGKKLITRLGFLYPPLTTLFETGKIGRQDTTSNLSMLKMVLGGRGDGAIMNDAVGAWIIKENQLSGQFVASYNSITNYGYRIMFSKEWEFLITAFNQELNQMKQTGEIEEICARYGYAMPMN